MGKSSWTIGVGLMYHRVLKRGWQEGQRLRDVPIEQRLEDLGL